MNEGRSGSRVAGGDDTWRSTPSFGRDERVGSSGRRAAFGLRARFERMARVLRRARPFFPSRGANHQTSASLWGFPVGTPTPRETAGRGSGLQPICPISPVVLRLHPLPVSMTAVWTCAPSSRPAARSFQVSTPRSPNFKSQTDSFHRPPLALHRLAHSPPTPILTV